MRRARRDRKVGKHISISATDADWEIRRANPILEDIKTRVAGPRFGLPMVLAGLIVLVFGMLIESRIHILYRWLWTG